MPAAAITVESDASGPYIGVIGASNASEVECEYAYRVGEELARRKVVLVCGGRGGVMEAACAGARAENGVTIGILPGLDRSEANDHVLVAIPTGMGALRDGIIVRAAESLIAIGGRWGTLAEIALALQESTPVVTLHSWDRKHLGYDSGVLVSAQNVEDAVDNALRLARRPLSTSAWARS